MIEKYRKRDIADLTLFVKENRDYDFYITKDNERFIINNCSLLKNLLKSSNRVLLSKEGNYINGALFIWIAKSNEVKRNYIKINATPSIADKLLTVLFWNEREDLYIKVNKSSRLLNVLRNKGFYFYHDRGNELLLIRRTNNGLYSN
jgi:hypothetical protein